MMRSLCVAVLLLAGCSSSDASGGGSAGSTGTGSCPDVSGSWKVTAHCDPSLVGSSLVVTQTECSLSFAAPFNAFAGHLAADGQISLSGPQTCTGTATASAISMTCTPGTCTVKLTR